MSINLVGLINGKRYLNLAIYSYSTSYGLRNKQKNHQMKY